MTFNFRRHLSFSSGSSNLIKLCKYISPQFFVLLLKNILYRRYTKLNYDDLIIFILMTYFFLYDKKKEDEETKTDATLGNGQRLLA